MKMMPAALCIALTLSLFSVRGEFVRLQDLVDTALLDSGQIQYLEYKDGNDIAYRTGAVLIDAPPETVWGIMEDLERLGSVLEHIEYYRIRHEASGNTLWKKGEILVEGRFAIDEFPAQFTVMMEYDHAGRWRKWRILTPEETASYNAKGIKVLPSSGLIKEMSGFEYLEPYRDGRMTVYYYAVNIESTIPMPEFMVGAINDAVYTGRMTRIREEAESLVEKPDVEGSEPFDDYMNEQDSGGLIPRADRLETPGNPPLD